MNSKIKFNGFKYQLIIGIDESLWLLKIARDYFKKTEEHQKIYGEKSVVLMQVGQFFEIYGLRDSTTKKITGSSIQDISQKCDLSISNKKVCVGKHGVVMSGFPEFGLEKYLRKMQDHGYTVAVYVQDTQAKKSSQKAAFFD